MKHGVPHIIFTLIWLAAGTVSGITRAPRLQRACLDRTTGVVTVYFTPEADGCGSFTKYVLYGRDNGSDPFTKLTENTVLGSTSVSATLINKKKWELFLTVYFACNGTDTLNSDTLFIDDTPPAYLEPDSVSIELNSQQMIAGWSKSPDPDVMGYSIFKVDPSTGNNTVIDEQNVLFYTFSTATFNSTQSGNRMALAAYDSCKNGGVISNFHSPVLAEFDAGQNIDYLCTRKIYFKWSAYKGWVVNLYDIYVKDNISNTWSVIATVPGSQLTYTFSIPALGRTYSFFIRAHKAASVITSSSNRIDFVAGDFVKPANLRIGHVSVITDGMIQITGKYDMTASVSKALLQVKNYGSSSWTTLATYTPPTTSFSYNDPNRNTSFQKYTYRILLLNTCNEAFDSSESHTSILLRRSFYTMYWNEYWAWFDNAFTTDLFENPKGSSTWNNLNTFPDSSYILADTTKAFCYRVVSLLAGGGGNPPDTAYSNRICIRVLDTTLIPNTFTPGGMNPVFKIINPNLEPGQAQMNIYNRWGEKIFSGDALVGWDGKDHEGFYLGPGAYPYLIEVFTPEKRKAYKGTVLIIR